MPGIGIAPTLAVPFKLHRLLVAKTHLTASELRSMVVSGSAIAAEVHGVSISAEIARMTRADMFEASATNEKGRLAPDPVKPPFACCIDQIASAITDRCR
jgi:hypothetical protein